MLQREQKIKIKYHRPPKCVVRPPFSMFTSSKVTPGPRGCKFACKLFRPRLGGLPHLPGVPHLHVNRPQDFIHLTQLILNKNNFLSLLLQFVLAINVKKRKGLITLKINDLVSLKTYLLVPVVNKNHSNCKIVTE